MGESSTMATSLLAFSCVIAISSCSSSHSISKKDKIAGMQFMDCYEKKINIARKQGTAKQAHFEDCLDSRMSAKSQEKKRIIAHINSFALTDKQPTYKKTISANRFNAAKKQIATAKVKEKVRPNNLVSINTEQTKSTITLPSLQEVLNKDTRHDNHNITAFNTTDANVSYKKVVAKTHITSARTSKHYASANVAGSRWSNIVKGFQLDPHLNKKHVKQFIDYYAKNAKAVSRLSQRAAVFLPMITNEISNRNMPMEIALLPFVESGFAIKAVSSASAAGLWQFIPETGKRYGLKKNARYDGRFNPDASTTAALDYLQDLHQRFNGDWLLALAAYNVGENRISREIAKRMKAGQPTDFWSLSSSLPKETRLYVPRLLAYRELIRRPDAYNIVLPSDQQFIELKRLRISKSIDLQQIAEQAKLPKTDILLRLNPNFTSGKTQPKYERNILVPSVYFDRVRATIHSIKL